MNKESLQKLISNFVSQLQTLWQQEAIAALTKTGGRSGAFRVSGAKRTSEDLNQIATKFIEFVAKHPGLRIEQINKQLGTTTKDLALPIRKLTAEKRLKVKGKKRSD